MYALINTRHQYGMTPLHCATQSGHIEVVRLLLELGASLDAPNRVSGVSYWGVSQCVWMGGARSTHIGARDFSWCSTRSPVSPPLLSSYCVFW